MSVVLSNNAVSRLASSLSSGATTLSVATGEGAKFPAPSAGQWFPMTIIKSSGSLEIVRCTARTGDVFTVARGQESTSSQAFSAGDRVELRVTSAAFAEFLQSGALSAFINGLLDDTSATEARATLELGTAATRNVQTSETDATTDRALLTGAFGLGSETSIPASTDLTASLRVGFYIASAGATGLPADMAGSGAVFLVLRTNFAILIEVSTPATRRVYHGVRTGSTGAWTWVKFIHEGSVSAFILSLLDDADALTARATLGVTKTANSSDANAGRLVKNGDKQVCSAWVLFNGTGTPSIRDSFNVSSITRVGVGNYTVNFTVGMSNTAYSVTGGFDSDLDAVNVFSGAASPRSLYIQESLKSTASFRVLCGSNSSSGSSTIDFRGINLQVSGGN